MIFLCLLHHQSSSWVSSFGLWCSLHLFFIKNVLHQHDKEKSCSQLFLLDKRRVMVRYLRERHFLKRINV